MFSLVGRNALVTGSSEGIGRAIAQTLARHGAKVAVHGLELGGCEAVCASIAGEGGKAMAFPADLMPDGSATALIETVSRRLGRIDILVSNVAVQRRQAWNEIDAANVRETVRINLAAVIELVQGAVPAMKREGWGRIVTIGSVQQARPHELMAVYAALKGGQVNLVRNLARSLAADGVTVNNIAPGVIDTERSREPLRDADYRARVLQAIPLGRIGTPEDIAGAALLLCSEAGAYITGADLFIDGGMQL